MTGRLQCDAILRSLPSGWPLLFGPVPGRSGKHRCLLCGRSGYWHETRSYRTFDGRQVKARPAGWMVACIGGHKVQCATCRRPFVNRGALVHHLVCKLHHACCVDHTTVPDWKNPFRFLKETA